MPDKYGHILVGDEPPCSICKYYETGIICEVRTRGNNSTLQCHSMFDEIAQNETSAKEAGE